jgi:short-subunit dehydrogenase
MATTSPFLTRYGPTALVTGASSGIGLAFARELADRGMNLVLVARRGEVLTALAAELSATHRVKVRTEAMDLAQHGAAAEMAERLTHEPIGLVVCSAGFGTSGLFTDGTLAEEAAMVDLNCRSLMELSWHFGRRLCAQKRGGLVLMSSLVGFQGVPRAANYAATKAYVQTLAEGLHHEFKAMDVDVVASAPGPIRSGFGARASMTMGMAQEPSVVAEATLNALGRRCTVRPGWLAKALELSLKPLPRWGRVRMMAKVMAGMTAHSRA